MYTALTGVCCFSILDSMPQVYPSIRQARLGLESRQHPPSQVLGHHQNSPLVPLDIHLFELDAGNSFSLLFWRVGQTIEVLICREQ